MVINGSIKISCSSEEDYLINGSADIHSIGEEKIILKNVQINGSVTIKNAVIENLIIQGSGKLDKIEVRGELRIFGVCKLENSSFNSNVHVKSLELIANNCVFKKDIFFERLGFFNLFRSPKLKLKNYSKALGLVSFPGQGKIITDSTSECSQQFDSE